MNVFCLLVSPGFRRILVVVRPGGTKAFVSFAFLDVRREGGSVGGKIGSEHKEDVNEICGWVSLPERSGESKEGGSIFTLRAYLSIIGG